MAEATEGDCDQEMLTSGYLGYECFQNYTAAEVFVQGLAGTVSREDTEAIIRAQKVMLQRFEKTNAMLTNCNALSAQRLQNTQVDFKRHVLMLTDMKKELGSVFERIRKLKAKLSNQYPKQFAEVGNRVSLAEEDEEEPAAAAASSAAAVRRRGRPRQQQQQQQRHSYPASASGRRLQESEPAPASSSDSEDGDPDPASQSSTNS